MEDAQGDWERKWGDILLSAKRHPALFIDHLQAAHLHAVHETLRLVWLGKVFERAVSATVFLSPTQYVVRCLTGPLLPIIQEFFPFNGERLLSDGWCMPWDVPPEVEESLRRRLPKGSWFGGPTGPWLSSPMNPLYLARRFGICIRTEAGLWSQGFEKGWPESRPFLVDDDSPVGLLAAGELDPEWFTGLPFRADDAERLLSISYENPGSQAPGNLPLEDGIYHFRHVTIEWHSEDDLLGEDAWFPDGLRRWLK
ncbi:MAG: hypothetical protein M3Y56_09875 [Armatimonadota bacterium]|nr:hypothetical protein [Armatimonadota bacterium]